MATSEIEKLERRYAENPHGLTFAPLAEVHRKNGDIPRALELLTAGLELHPNYIPASIVLGRCHQDLGDLSSAEAAFAHVLRLDDENVIALKSLADINERLERYSDAESWLRRLVAIDRSNEEAREQLSRVEAARQGATAKDLTQQEPEDTVEVAAPAPVLEIIDPTPEAATIPEPPVAPSAEPAPVVAERPGIREPEVSPEPDVSPEPEVTPEPVSQEPERTEAKPLPYIPGFAAEAESPKPPAETVPAPAAHSELPLVETSPASCGTGRSSDDIVQPLAGLISAEFQPPLEATGGLGVETSDEVVLEVSGNSEFQVPDASEDLKSVAARLTQRPDVTVPDQHTTPHPEVAPPPPVPAPEFVVTERMAEVLMQQGHMSDALHVYRELLRRNDTDPRLQQRIADLEAGLAAPPSKPKSYLAQDTNGQSVAAFFRSLLATRLPATSGTRHSDTTSLAGKGTTSTSGQNGGSVVPDLAGYGEEEGVRAPPAVPSGEPAEEAPVSFDDFFGAKPEGSTPLRQGKAESGKDDLDDFQSWLQNLKR